MQYSEVYRSEGDSKGVDCAACGGTGYVPGSATLLSGEVEEALYICSHVTEPIVIAERANWDKVIHGFQVAASRAKEILASFDGTYYYMQSESNPLNFWEVDVKNMTCDCPAKTSCYHVVACRDVDNKTSTCTSCSKRVWNRKLFYAERDALGFLEGQPVCRPCADIRGL